MNVNEKINYLLKTAEDKKAKGELNIALEKYLEALRIVTPDDFQIEIVIGLVGLEGKSIVEDPEADKVDSFLRSKIVETYREIGDFNSAFHHAAISLFLDLQLWGKLNNDTSASYQDLGLIEFERRNFTNSEKWLAKSCEIDDHLLAFNPNQKEIKMIYFRKLIRTSLSAEKGYLLEAARGALEILPNIEEGLSDIIRTADVLNCCAQNLQNLCEHSRAKEILNRAIELHRESDLINHPQMGRLYSNMADLLHELWDFKAAENFWNRSLAFHQTKSDYKRKTIHALNDNKEVIDQFICRFQREQNYINDVFISFNTHDEKIVKNLYDNLHSYGIKTWIFWDMKDWRKEKTPQEIIDQTSKTLLTSKIVVMVASGTSITSKYVFEEVKFCIDNRIPLLIWFPEGVRLFPIEASTISVISDEHLLSYINMIFQPGVYSLFGYGMRGNDINIISKSIIKWLSRLCAIQTTAQNFINEDLLTPTRLLPVFIDQKGNRLFQLEEYLWSSRGRK